LHYNKLGTEDYASFEITFDQELWDEWMFPMMNEFAEKVMSIVYEVACGDPDTTDYQTVFDKHAYPRFTKGELPVIYKRISDSVAKHVVKI